MCKGFGGIVTLDGRILFSEPDEDGDCSHSTTLKRLGMDDNRNEFRRNFVRFQFPNWKPESFEWDEEGTLPGWVTDEHKDRCQKLLAKVAPAWEEYVKVRALAWAEYVKVRAPAWEEYVKVRDAAWAEYEKVRAPAWAEYEKVRDAAWAEYEKVCTLAWAEYEKVRDAAWAALLSSLSNIEGYVPAEAVES